MFQGAVSSTRGSWQSPGKGSEVKPMKKFGLFTFGRQ